MTTISSLTALYCQYENTHAYIYTDRARQSAADQGHLSCKLKESTCLYRLVIPLDKVVIMRSPAGLYLQGLRADRMGLRRCEQTGRPQLLRGRDTSKDQSYFLASVEGTALSGDVRTCPIVFPLLCFIPYFLGLIFYSKCHFSSMPKLSPQQNCTLEEHRGPYRCARDTGDYIA